MPYCFFSNLLIKLYACSVLFIFVLYLARQAMETISVYIACLSNLVAPILRRAAIRPDRTDRMAAIQLSYVASFMRDLCVFLLFCIFYILFGAVVLLSVTLPFFFTCRLRIIRYTFNTILVVALWRVLIARSQIARNLWQFILALVLKFVRFSRLTGTIRQ